MEKFNQVKVVITQIEADSYKFYNKGNSVAGTRLRKAMQALKMLATDVRKDVTARKHAK